MPRRSRLALVAVALATGACAAGRTPVVVSSVPDCRPMVARVILSCWYGGKDQPISQCEVGKEEPAGCGIGPAAVAYFNGGVDMSPTFYRPDHEDRPRWVQFNVYRQADGQVGRKWFGRADGEHLRPERRFGERPPGAE